jgi:hypothetical protein
MSEERDQERFLVVLICIILFISIEVFRGNDLAALYHLDSGINLLKEIKGPRMGNGWLGRAAEGDDIEDELLPMFARWISKSFCISASGLFLLTFAPFALVPSSSLRGLHVLYSPPW